MIYFLDNDLELQKIVTSENINRAYHENEMNNLKMMTLNMDLAYAKSFLNDDIDHFGYYVKDAFHVAKIRRLEESHDGETLTVIGHHIFFSDMNYGRLVEDVRPVNRDAAFILSNTIGANTRWHPVITDTTGVLSTNFYWTTPMEVVEFVVENFRLEFEPEILFDGQKVNGLNVHFKKRLGEDRPKRVVYGPNTPTLEYNIDYSEIVTKLAVHGKGEEVGDGYGRRINFSDRNINRDGIISPLGSRYLEDPNVTANYGNFDNEPKHANVIFEDIENVNELIEAGIEEYERLSRPQYIFTATVADIGDVNIGDSVLIVRREYGIYFRARVHKISVDLLNPDDAEVVLGDYEHFKETKAERSARRQRESNERAVNSRITQLKNAFDARFDGEVAQMWEDYEQALIDAHAEIDAAEQRMTGLIDTERDTMMEDYNTKVDDARDHAEQQAQEKATAVRTDLETVTSGHQTMIDSLQDNVMDIDTFLGDKTITLKQQFDKVRTDFGTLQSDLDGVESDLTATKSDLQKQLDAARAELEGLEVGGRNLLPNSNDFSEWTTYQDSSYTAEKINNGYTNIKTTGGNHELKIYIRHVPTVRDAGENLTLSFDLINNQSEGILLYPNRSTIPRMYVSAGFSGRIVMLGGFDRNTQFQFRTINSDDDLDFDIRNMQLEQGNIATDWTPAPEDTEQKITTLNEQIEYIDGQLSAKLEQTDIEPLQNKITEYGNTLTANAQSIQSLLDKTELHDGDITKWSNETEANAESISQTLTRVEETEAGISQAQTDIQTNADGIAGVIRDVETIDGELSTLTTDFNIEAGKIETLISKTDGHDTQLTNIVADYNSIEQTVAANDEWLGTHGSNVLQTVDGFEQKVWMSDIQNIGANLIPFSDTQNRSIMIENWDFLSDGGSTFYTSVTSSNFFTLRNTISGSYLALQSRRFERLVAGHTYTLSFHVQRTSGVNSNYNYTWIVRPLAIGSFQLGSPTRITNNGDGTYTHEYVFTSDYTGEVGVRIGAYTNRGKDLWLRIKEPKLERGAKRTPYMTAFSVVEQRAEELSLRVQELSSINGEELLSQSDISVLPDRVLIGSQNIGAMDVASIISVSPSAIDMITDELNLTGNLNVKRQITALAVDAIEGNFSQLWAAEFSAITIDVDDIQGFTARFEYLYTLNANIERLVSQTAFINEINTLSLNAVYGDISELRTELLTSNVILSRHVNSSMALIDKIFSEEAYIERLTSKSAFIRDIQAIEITANQLNLTTLTNRINQIEGGLKITRPDGVDWVRNGQARGHVPVQVSDGYAGPNIRFNGTNFITGSSNYQTMKYFYTPHEGTRLRVVFAVGLFGGPSGVEFMHVRVRGFSGYNPINMGIGSNSRRVRVVSGETNYVTLDIPMAPPNYAEFAAYLEIRRDPDGQHSDNEVYARLLHIGQYE